MMCPFDSSLIRTQAEEPFKESVEDLDLTSAELIVSGRKRYWQRREYSTCKRSC
jgi:hypothetical protein